MRGFQRIRGSASALSVCSAPSVRSSPAAGLLSSELSAPSKTHIRSTRPTQAWQTSLQTQRRCLSTSSPRSEKNTSEAEIDETHDLVNSETEAQPRVKVEAVRGRYVRTDLIIPSRFKTIPGPNAIDDPEYVPAVNGEGLGEIGGIEGWWDRPNHWGESKNYIGFGPTEKVTDPVLLELITKRALVEYLLVRRYKKKGASVPSTWLNTPYGKKELLEAAQAELVIDCNGNANIKDTEASTKIWDGLIQALRDGKADAAKPHVPAISVEMAREWAKGSDASWKTSSLTKPALKFFVSDLHYDGCLTFGD